MCDFLQIRTKNKEESASNPGFRLFMITCCRMMTVEECLVILPFSKRASGSKSEFISVGMNRQGTHFYIILGLFFFNLLFIKYYATQWIIHYCFFQIIYKTVQ